MIDEILNELGMVDIFLLIPLREWLENVCIFETQSEEGMGSFTFGELLCFLGVCYLRRL